MTGNKNSTVTAISKIYFSIFITVSFITNLSRIAVFPFKAEENKQYNNYKQR